MNQTSEPASRSDFVNGLLEAKDNGKILCIEGSGAVVHYLARMNFHRVLELPEPEHFRRPESGRFIPIMLVKDGAAVFDAVNAIADVVLQQFDGAREFIPAFEWSVNEIVDNVFIHAESKTPGVVCAQLFPNQRRLDIAICDSGIGIKQSLSNTYSLNSDDEAIKKALERGATRDTNVGQGNGLAGSLEILTKNGGSFSLWSGNSLFSRRGEEAERFDSGPNLPGTGVVMSFDLNEPVQLADTWIGERGWSYIDSEAERVSEHGIKIKDVCSHTGSRPPATRLRRKILALLPEIDGPVKIDFTDVSSFSSSFLDELLGRLTGALGNKEFNKRIIVFGLSELHRNMANNVIGQRLALDRPNAPAANAWLLTTSEPRLANLPIATMKIVHTDDARDIHDGDWILLVDEHENVVSVGQVMRRRFRTDDIRLYFDRYQAVLPAHPMSMGELTIGQSDSVVRLDWSDFVAIVRDATGASFEATPLVEDVVYVRDLLELAVRDDLLGPAEGPHELIKDMSVRDRYLVGKLAPRQPEDDQATRVEPASAANESGDLEDERTAPLHEPGAEFASASGRVEPEDDTLDEIDTTNNQSLVPSSMGFTFCVAPDEATLAVDARWGRYERVPNDEHEIVKTRKNRETGHEEEVKVRVWQRTPCGGVVALPLADGPIKPSTPDRDQPDVRLQGIVRTNNKGERLVTLFLVNGQFEPEDNKDRAWLFQPEISVEAAEGQSDKSVFRRRPSNEVVVDDPERDRLALIYRNRLEFAVGHGVSVHADTTPEDPTKAHRVRTEIIPRYEVAATETPGFDPLDRPAMRRMLDEGWLDMTRLAEMNPDALREALSCLIDDYAAWIDEQKKRLETEITGFDDPGNDVLERCEEILRRLREGMSTIFTDAKALEAFRFANRSMAMQRVRSIYALKRRRNEDVDIAVLDVPKNRSWRPFQLAFLLLSIPSLADPAHPDRTKPVEAFADLIWFPTGGGKTEAYLGVAAFAMAMRRLKSDLGGLDATRGLAVIMRYTLRLLTLQQFQRAATLLCAMEVIRRADDKTWGKKPFSLGLWVGNRVTPGTTEASHQAIEAIRNNDRNKAGITSPAQLTSCPWCGSEISGGRDIEVDRVAGRTLIHCGDKLGGCEFSKAKSSGQPHPGLPVKVVDEEIYHRPPTMMIATVDKFAMMAWRPEVRNLFGRVDQECERHGLLWPSHDCGTGHRARGAHPAAKVKPVRTIRPPDLIIQDEFHLISGPLGTMVALYETAVDELSSWVLGETKVRPKIVASTATVRRADDQVRNVFMRRISVFPPSGLDVEDNFFSVQRPISEKPGRRYIGVCAPGSSRPAVLIRTYTAFLTAAQALFDRFGPVADPYMTLVGYFNSLRELGGMKRLAEDDVQTRSFRVNMSLVDRPGLSQRRVEEVSELTSRVSSQDIPRYLDQLEVPFEGAFDPAQGKWVTNRKPGEARPIDAVLATNMLSVGVDVNRLGVMVVNGQPKGTAEYIQATSRVGRTPPGLVATVLTWARPRDLSHYETFEHYHATFYQHVEAQSVTPFSPRALDRGLTGAMLSIMRHTYGPFAANDGAGAMNSPSLSEMLETIGVIAARTWEVTEDSGKKALTEAEMKSRADEWANEAGIGGRTLVYQKYGAGPIAYPLLAAPGVKPWTDWTVPMSMREVEPGVRLVMEDGRSASDPTWRPRVTKTEADQA